MSARVAVIDSGICNLRSVTKALEAVGASPVVVESSADVDRSGAGGLVLPGVGALRDCVGALRSSGLDATVREWIAANRPFLGVCLGMQALFEGSEEGGVRGLGIFAGRVVRFRLAPPLKVPHMGWNTVRFVQRGTALRRVWRTRVSRSTLSTATTVSLRTGISSLPNAITGRLSWLQSPRVGCSQPSSIRRRARPRDC